MSLVGHEFRMFLNDKHEAGFTINMNQPAVSKLDLEGLHLGVVMLGYRQDLPALLFFAASSDVQHTFESFRLNSNLNLDPVGKTLGVHVRLREISSEFSFGRLAEGVSIAGVALDAGANPAVSYRSASGVLGAVERLTRIVAGLGDLVAVPVISAVIINQALDNRRTVTIVIQPPSMFR